MPNFIRWVQPPLHYIPVAYRPWVMRVVHGLLPLLLKVRVRPWLPAGISRIEVENIEDLVDLYQQQSEGKARFLMAVRHVEVDDPLSGLYLCSRAVKRAAKAKGIRLPQPVHTHFIYERGMTIWAGRGLGWLLSSMGGTSIRRGKRPDWIGLKAARKLMTEGEMPLVVAPEGATNGHSQRLGPLEPGVAQLAFWCAEDLQKADRPEQVYVIPIGIQYRYEQADWLRLNALIDRLAQRSGFDIDGAEPFEQNSHAFASQTQKRIFTLADHLIARMEAFYERWFPTMGKAKSEIANGESTFDQRLQTLLDKALSVAEQFFTLPGKGTLVDRCRRLEEASWERIYREDLAEQTTVSDLDRGLADWIAETASLFELHMRLVESFVAASSQYLLENPSFERCAEISLLMSDILARIGGDKLPARPRLGQRWVQLTVQSPLAVTPRLADYQDSRRSGRKAVATLTEEIRQALEKTIVDSSPREWA